MRERLLATFERVSSLKFCDREDLVQRLYLGTRHREEGPSLCVRDPSSRLVDRDDGLDGLLGEESSPSDRDDTLVDPLAALSAKHVDASVGDSLPYFASFVLHPGRPLKAHLATVATRIRVSASKPTRMGQWSVTAARLGPYRPMVFRSDGWILGLLV